MMGTTNTTITFSKKCQPTLEDLRRIPDRFQERSPWTSVSSRRSCTS